MTKEELDAALYEFMTLERELAIKEEECKELRVQNVIMESMLRGMGMEGRK